MIHINVKINIINLKKNIFLETPNMIELKNYTVEIHISIKKQNSII